MLNDFFLSNPNDAQSPWFGAKMSAMSCNGICIVINNSEELIETSFEKMYCGLPLALDLTRVSNPTHLKKATGLETIDYFIVSSKDALEYLPTSAKTIFVYNVREEDGPLQLDDIFSNENVSIFDIRMDPSKKYSSKLVVELLSTLIERHVAFTLCGVPCCRWIFSKYANRFKRVCRDTDAVKASVMCLTCCLYHNGCDGAADDIIRSFPSRLKSKNRLVADLPNVDAILLYSGGLDSRLSAHMFMEEHRDMSLLMVHFSDHFTLSTERVKVGYFEEFQNVPQIKGLLLLSLAPSVYGDIINNKQIIYLSNKKDVNLSCLMCKAIFIFYAALIGKQLGAKSIVIGNNLVRGFDKKEPPLPQDPLLITEYTKIPSALNMETCLPLYHMCKRIDVVEAAKKFGIDLSSSWFSSQCPYGTPKALRFGLDFAVDFLSKFITSLLQTEAQFIDLVDRDLCNVEFIT